jgi:class 3 adenylate cyclase/HAMP domain-containing protein
MWWLPLLIVLVNLGIRGLITTYSALNLRPFLEPHDDARLLAYRVLTFALALSLPTIGSIVYLWPIFRWLRRAGRVRAGQAVQAPDIVVIRAANAPLALAAMSLCSWMCMALLLYVRIRFIFAPMTLGIWIHFIIRPLLGGMIAAAAVFFACEYLCRTHVWPLLFARSPVGAHPRVWKIRLVHRLVLLWMAISFLPLSAVIMTALIRMDRLDAVGDPLLFRIMAIIIIIGASAVLGGAWLAWLLARSMGRPLRALEAAMERLRSGDFSVREVVSATDEIGTLTEGFNLMAQRLETTYSALEARNRELAQALDRVAFLESVKRGLDRFVPDTVRRLIEGNPDAPALQKVAKDVTVLFLDIEGYARLSEACTREEMNALVERYFSLYLADIQDERGDINETAGDGLMILFQEGTPDEHAAAAVRTALAIRAHTAAANAQRSGRMPPIAVNIGISSGECHVGSTRFHSAAGDRWTFTATGPVTNLAARLEDQATGGQILVSSATAHRVRGRFLLRSLGLLRLKNIAAPEEAWEVFGTGETAPRLARKNNAHADR